MNTNHSLAEQSNPHLLPAITRSPVVKLLKQTLIQLSVHPTYGKQTLIQPSVHRTYGKQTLVYPSVPRTPPVLPNRSLIQCRASPPSLLTLQPQPNLRALARSLTPQAQRYISIGIQLSHQVSQPGPPPDPSVMDLTEDGEMGGKEGTPKPRPGKESTSGSTRMCDGTE